MSEDSRGADPAREGDGAAQASSGLPAHLDPRGPRNAVPPRPRRTTPPQGSSRTVVPAAAPRHRRRERGLGRRLLSGLAVLASAAVLVSSVGGYVLVNRYDDNLNRITDLGLSRERPAELPEESQNILIVGSDSREGPAGKGKGQVDGERSDTIILAHLYADADQAQLISFPRDSWVTLPAHLDAKTGQPVPARESKINSALFSGGPSLLIDTVESVADIHVDHYLQVDFNGFNAIVERLGGVEVCLLEPVKERKSRIDLKAGRQTIRGEQAIAFVRQRNGLPNGDIDRIKRQQAFIGGIVRKVLSTGTLLNPLKLNGVITDVTRSLQVDEGLDIATLQDLALRLRGFDAGGVAFTTVPITDPNARRERQSVVLLDEVKLKALFDEVRRDVPPGGKGPSPRATAPARPLTVQPGEVRVRVLNGSGVRGLARAAFDDLAKVGFQVVDQPRNRGTGQSATVVRHGPAASEAARTLAAALPGSTVELDPALGGTLEAVIGSDYQAAPATAPGDKPVQAAPQTPRPSASPAVRTAAQQGCIA